MLSLLYVVTGPLLKLALPPLEEVTTTGYDSTLPNLEHLLNQLEIEKNKMIQNNLEFEEPIVGNEMQNQSEQTRKG